MYVNLDDPFLNGAVLVDLLDDQGADTNLIPAGIFQRILKKSPDTEIATIQTPHAYTEILSGPASHCSRKSDIGRISQSTLPLQLVFAKYCVQTFRKNLLYV